MSKDYLTTKQVAEILDVTPMTITRWAKAGLFPGTKKSNPTKVNSPLRIPRTSVEKYQEMQVITPEEDPETEQL